MGAKSGRTNFATLHCRVPMDWDVQFRRFIKKNRLTAVSAVRMGVDGLMNDPSFKPVPSGTPVQPRLYKADGNPEIKAPKRRVKAAKKKAIKKR